MNPGRCFARPSTGFPAGDDYQRASSLPCSAWLNHAPSRGKRMTFTVLYPESDYPDDSVERRIYGPDVRVVFRNAATISDLSDEDCAAADGLMLRRLGVIGKEFERFTKLRCVLRMGVGYDQIDRKTAAQRQVIVCNIPDYGTTEVADHAIALTLALRRGLLLHHEWQRKDPPAPWRATFDPLIRRLSVLNFGVVPGPHRYSGSVAREGAWVSRVLLRSLSSQRSRTCDWRRTCRSLEDLLRRTDTLSVHTPLTPGNARHDRAGGTVVDAEGVGAREHGARTDRGCRLPARG